MGVADQSKCEFLGRVREDVVCPFHLSRPVFDHHLVHLEVDAVHHHLGQPLGLPTRQVVQTYIENELQSVDELLPPHQHLEAVQVLMSDR